MTKRILIAFLRLYKFFISPLLPPSCRFYPSCSDYAQDAIRIHGAPKGASIALWRLLRCHPYSKGGNDPVPIKQKTRSVEERKIRLING